MSRGPGLVLVLNCGSSSLKFALHEIGVRAPSLSGLAERLGEDHATITVKDGNTKTTRQLPNATHAVALDDVLNVLAQHGWLDRLSAVGHRVAHGGERFAASVIITPQVIADIEAASHLAPLHNPAALLGIRVALQRLPGIPHAAVFDTAFHQTMPRAAYMYALPMWAYRDHGVRRYGFHGTSHRFVAQEAVRMLDLDPHDHGMVIAHLGNGSSATAVVNGRSVDTTMGLTPLEGLVMGSRSGDVDPGALVYLMRSNGWTVDELDTILNRQSGLFGLSELSHDCRELTQAAASGDDGATMAIEVLVHRLARAIGGLATSLQRLDAVVFTGGIGENAAGIREMALRRLAPLGLDIDPDANSLAVGGVSGLISAGSRPAALVVNTNEEWMIACDTAELAQQQQTAAVA
ncbi:Acetate kinase [Rhodovastum atsumiense]|uniref:Acetate kinase n=1 Tax=Rhodovastum atsumiense TaxID=504468 RepID=A0A5M6IYG0_9PROT|nr:acetate kinase [Rhodovastum atsumiense]KAA5613386.1 acetate kinase [Rhodovastum atsumiense]CAH2603072.1 Acetate kinase [Rhodovastum atsumiense]